jgi:hypothetical protein
MRQIPDFAHLASIVPLPPGGSAEFSQWLQAAIEIQWRWENANPLHERVFGLGWRLKRKRGRRPESDLLMLGKPPHHARFWQFVEYMIYELFALGGDPHVNRSAKQGHKRYGTSRRGYGNLVDLIEELRWHLPDKFIPKTQKIEYRLERICAQCRERRMAKEWWDTLTPGEERRLRRWRRRY